jgi:hypothetical protein
LAGARQAQIFDAAFAVLKRLLRAMLGATGFVVAALVQAKENVALEVRSGVF